MNMYEKLLTLASQNKYYEIPIQHDTVWSLKTPHALISSVSGFGKSYFVTYLISIMSIKNNILYFADPKRSDLASLAAFMPQDRVAWESEDIQKMLKNVVDIMMKRYEYMNAECQRKGIIHSDFTDFGLPAVVVIIEEMAAFISTLDKKSRESFEADIKSITLQGRQAGVNLCLIMQNPGTQNITTESRSQMGFRVYLGDGNIERRMIFGDGFTYSKRSYIPGQGLYMIAGKTLQPEYIETPKLDKSQLPKILKQALKNQFNISLFPPTT